MKLFNSFSVVTSVMSIQFLKHDQDGQNLLHNVDMAPITSHYSHYIDSLLLWMSYSKQYQTLST